MSSSLVIVGPVVMQNTWATHLALHEPVVGVASYNTGTTYILQTVEGQ